jgi:site-specific DNA-methyltransferase (adenine-specific)
VSIDLRCGRWQDVLADVQCDLLCVDAPYSARTHAGHDAAVEQVNGGSSSSDGTTNFRGERSPLGYRPWNNDDVRDFVASWSPRTRNWMVSITDHVLAPAWADAMEAQGLFVFAPLPFVAPGSRIRILGDGPSCWTCWIVVGRPRNREAQQWGTLPGAYVLPPGENTQKGARNDKVIGGKPLWLMRCLVRGYSRPGDLVCDPTAGSATTLLAAAIEGRRAVGAESDPATFALAQRRIAKGYTPDMFASAG